MKHFTPAVACLASLCVVVGCSSTPDNPDSAPGPGPRAQEPGMTAPASMRPLTGKWTVVSIGGKPVAETLQAPHLEFTMMGGAVGFTGVNRYSTRATVGAGGSLTLAPGVTTKMAGSAEAMALESSFLHAMNTANGVLVGEGRMAFTRDGETVMVLSREGNRE